MTAVQTTAQTTATATGAMAKTVAESWSWITNLRETARFWVRYNPFGRARINM